MHEERSAIIFIVIKSIIIIEKTLLLARKQGKGNKNKNLPKNLNVDVGTVKLNNISWSPEFHVHCDMMVQYTVFIHKQVKHVF